jgi:hypothetical protein
VAGGLSTTLDCAGQRSGSSRKRSGDGDWADDAGTAGSCFAFTLGRAASGRLRSRRSNRDADRADRPDGAESVPDRDGGVAPGPLKIRSGLGTQCVPRPFPFKSGRLSDASLTRVGYSLPDLRDLPNLRLCLIGEVARGLVARPSVSAESDPAVSASSASSPFHRPRCNAIRTASPYPRSFPGNVSAGDPGTGDSTAIAFRP